MGAGRRLHLFREQPERGGVLDYVLENLDGLVDPLSLAWNWPIRSLPFLRWGGVEKHIKPERIG